MALAKLAGSHRRIRRRQKTHPPPFYINSTGGGGGGVRQHSVHSEDEAITGSQRSLTGWILLQLRLLRLDLLEVERGLSFTEPSSVGAKIFQAKFLRAEAFRATAYCHIFGFYNNNCIVIHYNACIAVPYCLGIHMPCNDVMTL